MTLMMGKDFTSHIFLNIIGNNTTILDSRSSFDRYNRHSPKTFFKYMPLNLSQLLKYKTMNKEEFDNYCFTIPLFDGFHGKRQLLEYSWENRFKIINELIDSKPIKVGHKDYDEVKQQVTNSVISPLLLDMHCLYIQLLEEFFGLCLSLTYNKNERLFWYYYYFCDSKSTNILPKDIYGEVQTITLATKQPNITLQKKIDFKYVFLSDLNIYQSEKEWNKIKQLLINITLDFAHDLNQRETYNHYKHRNRVFTHKLPIKLEFQNQDGSTHYEPVGGGELLSWFTINEGLVETNTIVAEFEESNKKCKIVIELFLAMVKAHLIDKHQLYDEKINLAKLYSSISDTYFNKK